MEKIRRKLNDDVARSRGGNLKGNEQKNCLFNSRNIADALQYNFKRKQEKMKKVMTWKYRREKEGNRKHRKNILPYCYSCVARRKNSVFMGNFYILSQHTAGEAYETEITSDMSTSMLISVVTAIECQSIKECQRKFLLCGLRNQSKSLWFWKKKFKKNWVMNNR